MHVTAPQPIAIAKRQQPAGHYARTKHLRFGNVTDGMARMFKPITEQFVYGFFAQDVVALWIPRIINALRRGRIPYNPQEDPAIREKKPLQQWLHSIYMNTKGLNYSNATEETLREVETGPGLLVAQSILYGLAATALFGKLAIMMGQQDLKDYKGAFVKSVSAPHMTTLLNGYRTAHPRVLEQKVMQQFMEDLLLKGHFKTGLSKTIALQSLLKGSAEDKALFRMLKAAFPGKTEVTYKDALKLWINRWVKMDNRQVRYALQASNEMETMFKRIALWFNDDALKITNPAKLNILNVPMLKHHPQTSVDHLLENVRKFRFFASETVGRARGQMSAGLVAKGWGENLQTFIKDTSEKMMRRISVNKFGLGLAATILAGVTVIWVSAIAQRGKAYPANRTLALNGLNQEGAQPHPQHRLTVPAFQGGQPSHVYPVNISHHFQQPRQLGVAADLLFAGAVQPGQKGGQ